MTRFGIIGNGVSAVTAVREIAKTDPSVEIDVFSEERHPYYPRPKLIDFVAGTLQRTIIQYNLDWYEKQNATLHIAEPVRGIDSETRGIRTDIGTYEGYDKIMIVTGSYPFVPPISGIEKRGMHVLKTLDDAIDIREDVRGSGREIVVGGGILGVELAAAIKHIGGEPIIVTNINTLLPAQLDAGASNVLVQSLEKMGLDILLNFTCSEVSGGRYVTGVVSTAGDRVEGDLVVAATGVKPNTHLARTCGIECNRGIVVNEYLQTSTPNIFSAGDCIEWNGQSYGIIPVALDTSRLAVRNMFEYGSVSYAGTVPSNTLQVAGIDLTSIGMFDPQSPEFESIVSSDTEAGTYYKVVVKDNIVVGGISMGSRKFALKLRKLIRTGEDISEIRKDIFED
ncbi:MAG: FAD-dependent oxidoreductase [Candidatus Thorarchaeota archaeon]